jgi:regulator of cell morphogenesis and NO signaling
MDLVRANIGNFNAVVDRLAPPYGAGEPPLVSLIAGIVTHHHDHARSELDRLSALAGNVGASDTARAGVTDVIELFTTLDSELRAHMTKEEMVVFPYIASLEGALRVGRCLARSPFSALQQPLGVMLDEQDQTRLLLASIRLASGGYSPPPGASQAVHDLYAGLEALEESLEEHGRLETEFLFPRALELEHRVRG